MTVITKINDRIIGSIRTALAIGSLVALGASSASAGDVGDLVQFSAGQTARAAEVNQNFEALKAAVNSKQDVGAVGGAIDSVASDSSFALTGPRIIRTLTASAPRDGYLDVTFTAAAGLNHFLAAGIGGSSVRCAIKTTPTSPTLDLGRVAGSLRGFSIPNGAATGSYSAPMATSGVIRVDNAGSVQIFAMCERGGQDPASISAPSLVVRFIADDM